MVKPQWRAEKTGESNIHGVHQSEKFGVEPEGSLTLLGWIRDIVVSDIEKCSRPIAVHWKSNSLIIPDQNCFAYVVALEQLDAELLRELLEQIVGFAHSLAAEIGPPVLNHLLPKTAASEPRRRLQHRDGLALTLDLAGSDQTGDACQSAKIPVTTRDLSDQPGDTAAKVLPPLAAGAYDPDSGSSQGSQR